MIIQQVHEMSSSGSAQDPCWVLVALSGALHAGSGHALGVLDEAVSAHPGAHVLVDLSGVTSLDDTALVAVAAAQESAAASGGVLSLHGASSRTEVLLQIWRLESAWAGQQLPHDVA